MSKKAALYLSGRFCVIAAAAAIGAGVAAKPAVASHHNAFNNFLTGLANSNNNANAPGDSSQNDGTQQQQPADGGQSSAAPTNGASEWADTSADSTNASAPGAQPAPAGNIKMTNFVIKDTQGTGIDAYTMLIPAGWNATGKVFWDTQRVAAPSDLFVAVRNPQGVEQFNRFPALLFTYDDLDARYVGIGKKKLGTIIAPPPKNDIAAIEKWVIPTYAPKLKGRYKIVATQQLPNLAQAAAPIYLPPGTPGTVQAAKVRIAYNDSGKQIQIDFIAIYLLSQGGPTTIWGLDQITAFKAEAGQLDAVSTPMTLMAMSLKPTLKFADEQDKVSKALMQEQYTDQAAIMQRVATQEQAGQQINQMIMQGYQQREQIQDQVAESFDSKVIRQVQDRTNPFTGEMEQEPDYSHVWVDQSGDHIYSNDSNYNPNGSESGTWQEEPAAN
jgi:hypothetical protein